MFIRLLLISLIPLIIIITSCIPPVSPYPVTLEDPIQTDSGLVSGISTDEIRIYKGIPFAAPPTGDLRWRPPQPVVPWQGIRQCTEFGPDPYQYRTSLASPSEAIDEDCLYLNVWTPAKKRSDQLPVMVWLYGGDFRFGAGSAPLYDGTTLAHHGVIVVTFNYRVGPIGFLAHPLLSKESDYNSSGNYGILDQIATLKWVQNNIAAFGGDPNNVTIFGESAGAISVACLMVSPLAKGLFHRAISQSLAEFGLFAHIRDNHHGVDPAENMGIRLAKDLGCDSASDPIAAMRAKSANEVMIAGMPPLSYLQSGYRYGPIVDGWILPGLPLNLFEAGKQQDIPYLLGSNADEWSLFLLYLPTNLESYQSYINRTFEQVLTLYAFTCTAKAYADAMSNVKSEAYFYQFARIPPGAINIGAFHALEIAYVFGNLIPILPTPDPDSYFDDTDKMLSEDIIGYWTRFAAHGDPNDPEAIQWPTYDEKSDKYLDFGDKIEVKTGLYTEACSIFQKISLKKGSE